MNELERVKKEALLSDAELYALELEFGRTKNLIGFYRRYAEVAVQAQLDKLLNHPSILVKCDDQSLPEIKYETFRMRMEAGRVQKDMLTPREGKVWVKAYKKEE
jgi:hypothetical protein